VARGSAAPGYHKPLVGVPPFVAQGVEGAADHRRPGRECHRVGLVDVEQECTWVVAGPLRSPARRGAGAVRPCGC